METSQVKCYASRFFNISRCWSLITSFWSDIECIYLFVWFAQAMRRQVSRKLLIIALTLAFPLGMLAVSPPPPTSCLISGMDICSLDDDFSQQDCSCGALCAESLAGILGVDKCCDNFQTE